MSAGRSTRTPGPLRDVQNSPGPRRPMNRPNRSTTARSHCVAIRADCISSTPTTVMTIAGTRLPTRSSRPGRAPPRDQNRDGDDVGPRAGARVIRGREKQTPLRLLYERRSSRSDAVFFGSCSRPSIVNPAASASRAAGSRNARRRRSVVAGRMGARRGPADERPTRGGVSITPARSSSAYTRRPCWH